jgi:NTP pyrophosphatase (non-canonical NTP hydrolase)
MDLEALQAQLRHFAKERDWDQFHSPKNLAMALAGEAGELLEHFQWLTEAQSRSLGAEPAKQRQVATELADIMIYLVRISDQLGIDLESAVTAKLAANAAKYPVNLAKGNAKKYTEFEPPAS